MLPAALAGITFWPLYVAFLVLALRTGKRRHFASLAALSLLASIYWHFLSVAMKGV
jgi:heme/copper-type cytochrome/quinol oxidase subunit 3